MPDVEQDKSTPAEPPTHQDMSIAETIISLIVAFVIAMVFRGFVVEGFAIPTGSMAPTLLGDHAMWQSPETGYVWATDTGPRFLGTGSPNRTFPMGDPMLGPQEMRHSIGPAEIAAETRSGDRVLVMKWFYMLFDPDRFDVMVFKNPTNPSENYIKRLIALPWEELWLADGDVFTRDGRDLSQPFRVQRKPEFVQRAVWQPIHDTAYFPREQSQASDDAEEPAMREFAEPWLGLQRERSRYHIQPGGGSLLWNSRAWPLDDRNAYNMLGDTDREFSISDVAVTMNITPESDDFRAALILRANVHEYEFSIAGNQAALRMRPLSRDDTEATATSDVVTAEISPIETGRVIRLECWHVDQSMHLFVNGKEVATLEYDWTPSQRLELATGQSVESLLERKHIRQPWVREARPSQADLEWQFGSSAAATIHRITVSRDLYYRADIISRENPDPAMATHPDFTATLNGEQFFMCGDNSAASLDSRKWGKPHPLIAEQIDPTPFVVHRQLIVGRAWAVYFPSPYEMKEGGSRFVPDFGRLRFIR